MYPESLSKIEKPSEIVLITSPKWKWEAVQAAGDLADGRGQVKLNQLIGSFMPQIPNDSKKVGAEFLKKWVEGGGDLQRKLDNSFVSWTPMQLACAEGDIKAVET